MAFRPSRPVRSAAVFATTLCSLAVLTGCGARVAPPEDGDGTAVTLTNCGKKVTYAHPPERVVTNDVGITEIMLALGLEDRMAGYAMPDDKGEAHRFPWSDGYGRVKRLSHKALSQEMVLEAKADLVFAGWSYGFSEADGFTPQRLEKHGIDSYLLTESCRNGTEGSDGGKARGVMSPLRALYTDYRNLGKLFGVEERAEKLIADSRRRIARVAARAPADSDRPSVFLYDSGRDKPLTSGRFAGPHDIITKAGGDHVMGGLKDSWTTVGWETVVERNPEVIVVNDYGDESAEQKKRFLKSYRPLAGVPAVRNDRIVTLDYADLVESPRNADAVERLAAHLRK